jgi:hypothetical protein
MKPVKVPPDLLDQLLYRIPPTFKTGQRLVLYLSENPESVTVDVNKNCALGNISDVAREVNHYLWEFRLQVSCRFPEVAILNRFGEKSHMWLWSIFEISEAANDQVHNNKYQEKSETEGFSA